MEDKESMTDKNNEQQTLLQIVERWRISEFPEYRGFRCANCQQYKNQSWYHWLNSGDENGNFKAPVHLCDDLCEPQYKAGTLVLKGQGEPQKIDRETFGNQYQFNEKTKEKFREIVASWPEEKAPELKAFSCDDCGNDLDIDDSDGERKGYHVWWKMDDNKTLAELHFHRDCGNNLGIYSKEETEK